MPRGRRTKLTPDVQKKIVDALSAGNYFEVACEYAGIASQTGLEWLARGRGQHCQRPSNRLYAEFAEAVEKAQADDETMTIARIKKAGQGGDVVYEKVHRKPDIITTTEKGAIVEKRGETVTERRYSSPDWTADAWRQERKHSQRWGRKERVTIVDLRPLIEAKAREIAASRDIEVDALIAEAERLAREALSEHR